MRKLQVAAAYFYPEICSWLIEQGLDGTMVFDGKGAYGM